MRAVRLTCHTTEIEMKKRSKQRWGVGDYFKVPLSDGSLGFGQVASIEAEMGSAICAFFAVREESSEATPSDFGRPFSVIVVTKDLLDSADWPVCSSGKAIEVENYIDVDSMRARRYVGTRIIGSGIAMKLVEAYFGLYPWNGFHDPNYLDGYLVSPEMKSKWAVYK